MLDKRKIGIGGFQRGRKLNLHLLAGLLERVPSGRAYMDDLEEAGRKLVFDHGAMRTVAMENMGTLPAGLAAISRVLEPLGYHATNLYPMARLKMTGRSFTHRDLPLIDGADVRLTNGAVDRVHADLTRAADGTDVWIVGGGALAADFARAGLLDEIVVSIAPVTLGAGRPLLSGRFDLQLLDTGRNVDFVCARYRVVGMLTEDLPDGE